MSGIEQKIKQVSNNENGVDNTIQGVILLQNEPLNSVLEKWLSWMALIVIFVLFLIYYSNYFAKSSECVIGKKSFSDVHNNT